MLQTRNAKRPAQAAVRFAVDAVDEGLLDKAQALIDDRPRDARRAAAPDLRPAGRVRRCWPRGVAASPGAATGEIVFTAADAVAAAADGRDVILVRPFTEADDVAGFHAAKGILTSEGGKASRTRRSWRAAWACPRVTGASDLEIDLDGRRGARRRRRRCTPATGSPSTAPPARSPPTTCRSSSPRSASAFETVLRWADELRTLRRARQRRHARGRAQGARVRRRGHRAVPHRAHVLRRGPPREDGPGHPGRRRRGAPQAPRRARCRCSRATSRGCSRRWRGCRSPSACSTRRCTSSCPIPTTCPRARSSDRARSLQEVNPMLGTRGVRLGLLYPEIYEMQVGR